MSGRAIDVRRWRSWGNQELLLGPVVNPCEECLDDWCTMNCSREFQACHNCEFRHSGRKLCTLMPELGVEQTEDGFWCNSWRRAQ